MLDLKTADWHGYNQTYNVKKFVNKFPQISGKIRINFRKFPEISELTTLETSYLEQLT